jgi:adenosylcobinamide-phosphate synthase
VALLALVFLILHLGAGLALPYKPGFLPYYYRWMEESGRDFEKRLNRAERSPAARAIRGGIVGVLMGLLSGIIGYFIYYPAQHFHYGFVLELLFLSCCVTFMTPMKVVKQIQKHLAKEDVKSAALALQPYTPEPLAGEDVHTVIRKTIEFIAISLNQFLLAPVFWFVLAGPAGLALYVTYSALRQTMGLPDPRRKAFGKLVRFVDMVLNLVPAIFSTFFLTVSALFVSRSSPWRAALAVYQQSRSYFFYYQGWLVTAVAGGLGITLGGPIRYSAAYSENHEWVGPPEASARLMPQDLSRASLLQYVFFMCTILFVSVLIMVNT